MLIKRSFTLKGHRTSVSLEKEFWELLESYAQSKGLSLAAVVEYVDEGRFFEGVRVSCLASALRIFVVRQLMEENLGKAKK